MMRREHDANTMDGALLDVIESGPVGLDLCGDREGVAPHAFSVVYEAIGSAAVGVVITDLEGRIAYSNPALLRLLGCRDTDSVVGWNASDLFDTNEVRVFSEVRAIIDMASADSQEFALRRPDGEVVDVEVGSSPVRNADGVVVGLMASFVDITRRKQVERDRELLIQKLQDALEKVRTLRGLLPICAACKSIRDDRGFWHQVEGYLMAHSDAEFTHGICPSCSKRLYGDVALGCDEAEDQQPELPVPDPEP